MRIWAIIWVCFGIQLSWANDICNTAVSLPISFTVCNSGVTTINFVSNFPSSTPPNTCVLPGPPPDLWLHINVPLASTNSYMIRRREGTTIDARAEVLYKFGCLPGANCCEFGMAFIGCFDFDVFPNAIILQNPIPGDYYIRVWDNNSAATGILNVSAHSLPADINDWIICDDTSGEGTGFKANQLIVQPGPQFDLMGYDPGFEPIDTCECSDPPLILFEADNFEIFLDGRITAKNDPDVEGSGFNYKMEFRRLPYASTCGSAPICQPLVKYIPENNKPLARVAIIDSGINTNHEAFENGHWGNDEPNDPDDCINVEKIGYDFRYDLATPEDSIGHGSWVAGTIIEDFPVDIQLEIMSLKFYSGNNDFLFDAICALQYAIDQGASTIVTSWGFRSREYPQLLSEVLQKSFEENTLICASAGNLGLDNDDPVIGKYPANAPLNNIISVTAFDENSGGVSSYANVGNHTVDLAAIDHVIAPSSALVGIKLTDRDSVVGTSISAPRVARTAAIMKAIFPTLKAEDIRACILESVDKSPALAGFVATGGTLNHKKALICAEQKAMILDCTSDPIIINGILINDVTYRTTSFIQLSAAIESTATIILESPIEILIDSSSLVKSGGQMITNLNDCSN